MKDAPNKTIHHFCKTTDEIQLPDQYRGVWRAYHVPSKFERTLNALKVPNHSLFITSSVFFADN